MQSLVAFEAAGLMRESRIRSTASRSSVGTAIDLRATAGRVAVTTSPETLASGTAAHLETSLKFMHAAAPVRVIRATVPAGAIAEYGLDPPRYVISLQRGDTTVLRRVSAPGTLRTSSSTCALPTR